MHYITYKVEKLIRSTVGKYQMYTYGCYISVQYSVKIGTLC